MQQSPRAPRTPAGLGRRGGGLWRATFAVYELNPTEVVLFTEACYTVDLCDRLRADIARDGLSVVGSKGQTVLNPAVVELRQQGLAFGRFMRQLGLPDVAEADVVPLRARGGGVDGPA